jgi:hypothetical protein
MWSQRSSDYAYQQYKFINLRKVFIKVMQDDNSFLDCWTQRSFENSAIIPAYQSIQGNVPEKLNRQG